MRYWLALLALLLPSAAQAAWFETSSAHFVVYADDSSADVRRFSEQLERYHGAMELLTGLDSATPSPSNRVTVYVVRNEREIERLAGSRRVAGFYIPRAGGSVAYVPRLTVQSGEPDFSMTVLLHEYAHHFLIANSQFPMPRWAGEGGAEFFASAEFTRDNGIGIGRPAYHRSGELSYGRNVTVRELVDPDAYQRRHGKGFDAFYGKSWLLYHYLIFTPERSGQLRRYVAAMAGGQTSLEAAEATFGDLAALEQELQRYGRQRRMMSFSFPADKIAIGPISVRELNAGEAAIMPVQLRSRRGVDDEVAAELVAEARAIAARYPKEPAVLAALAEAEYDAGNDAEAIAAADAALALDPKRVNAYVQKGYALFRRARDADDAEAAYKEAVKPMLALNRIENDHPLPLIYFFRSFVERNERPPEQAMWGLERASELAPFDLGLRHQVAVMQINERHFDAARANLVPIAFNPHGGSRAEAARRVIEHLDATPEPEPRAVMALLNAAVEEAEEEIAGGEEG